MSVYIYIYIYMYIYICIYLYVCIYLYIYVYVYMYISICIYLYVYTAVYACVHVICLQCVNVIWYYSAYTYTSFLLYDCEYRIVCCNLAAQSLLEVPFHHNSLLKSPPSSAENLKKNTSPPGLVPTPFLFQFWIGLLPAPEHKMTTLAWSGFGRLLSTKGLLLSNHRWSF